MTAKIYFIVFLAILLLTKVRRVPFLEHNQITTETYRENVSVVIALAELRADFLLDEILEHLKKCVEYRGLMLKWIPI